MTTLKTPEGVDRAFKKLDSIKGDLVWWEAGAQPPQLLGSGEVVMTSAYNGRITAANNDRQEELQDRLAGRLRLPDRQLGHPRRTPTRRRRR